VNTPTGAETLQTARWRAVFVLFERVVGARSDARRAELVAIEHEHPDLYPRLLTLLAADDGADSEKFMGAVPLTKLAAGAATSVESLAQTSELAGQMIGVYRVIRPIGVGGMGQVWLAERADGRYEGKVAIKLLRTFGDALTAQRFQREGELLGRLQHPNIARLIDAGAMGNGQLYLVLEYVEGDRIDRYCDERKLSIADRIASFLAVCDAVSHAHANLVVHRDLKPSNILVTIEGAVKLLDFGVAKLLDARTGTDDAQELTQLVGRAFTPEFAAPEQIRGEAISTRTDVYALGAILYRLLSGVDPHGAKAGTEANLLQRISTIEPARMSTALLARQTENAATDREALAANRATHAARLSATLRGDLDTVIAKALKIQPEERYQSVAALRDDLQRYLNKEPISVRTDSASYRLRKFVSRHRIGVAASAAITATLIAGVAGTLWQANLARQESNMAEANAERARAFEREARQEAARARSDELTAQAQTARAETSEKLALESQQAAVASAQLAQNSASKAREQSRIAEEFRLNAEREAKSARRELARAERVSAFLGSMYRDQDPLGRSGTVSRAPAELLGEAVSSVERELADDSLSQAQLLRVLAEAQLNIGDLKGSSKSLELAAVKANGSDASILAAEVDSLRGVIAWRELRRDDAVRWFDSALAQTKRVAGADSVAAARINARYAMMLVSFAQFQEARQVAESAYGVLDKALGANHRETIEARVTLGVIQEQQREDSAARMTLEQAIASTETVFGANDARLARPLTALAEVLRRQREFGVARSAFERAARITRRHLGERHDSLATLLIYRATMERDAGDSARAIALLDEAERALPPEQTSTRAQLHATRGGTFIERGDGLRAEPDLREALRMRRESGGLRTGMAWFSQAQLGQALALQRRFSEAHALQSEAADELRKLLGPDAYQNSLISERRAKTFDMERDWNGAVAQWREAARISEKVYGREHFSYLARSLGLALSLSRFDEGRAEATQIADALLAQRTSNQKIADIIAQLMILRCELHAAANETAAARALAAHALSLPQLQADEEQRTTLARFVATQ
jgi:eukaryotic-like serine/threonine-protein kinase